tara:strand:+ start:844 stop:1614 length:771 start_codon:yes stop_codon:yes gene_type:complete
MEKIKHKIKAVMLPTQEVNWRGWMIVECNGGLDMRSRAMCTLGFHNPQHLYVTVSQDKEPITDSCWVIATKKDLSRELLWFVRTVDGVSSFSENFAMEYVFVQNEDDIVSFSKIIATDDPKLKTGVFAGSTSKISRKNLFWSEIVREDVYNAFPRLQQSFLKEFVANPDGEFEVDYELCNHVTGGFNINTGEVSKNVGVMLPLLKLNQDNTVNITNVEEKMYSKEEVDNLPIRIHEGIYNTKVYIKNGIVNVEPNK